MPARPMTARAQRRVEPFRQFRHALQGSPDRLRQHAWRQAGGQRIDRLDRFDLLCLLRHHDIVRVRHLRPALEKQRIRGVLVRRKRVLAGTTFHKFSKVLSGATFRGISRRGKYLLFSLQHGATEEPLLLLGHLGMTGRMYVCPAEAPLAKHAAVVLDLGADDGIGAECAVGDH